MKFIYTGHIEEGVLKIRNRKGFEEDIQRMKFKEVVITLEKKKKQRSNEQNRYYHGCIVPIVRHALIDLGHDVGLSDTHEFLKANFLKKEIINETTGEIYILPMSTAELTTTGFMEFILKIQQWATEYLNINIPDPNQQIDAFDNSSSIFTNK